MTYILIRKEGEPTPLNREEQFLTDIFNEVNRARELHPSTKHLLAALVEEVGEAARALIDHDTDSSKCVTPEDIYKELVQSAAMCLRVAIDTDPSFKYPGYVKA